ALLAFRLARRLGGPPAGLAAAGLVACAWPLVFFEGELLDAAILPGCVLSALVAVEAAADRPSAGRGLLAGALLGVSPLVRPHALPLAAVVPIRLGWATRRRRGPGGGAAAAALALGAVLGILPATVRNARVSGTWVPISANGGINLYVGNNPEAD